MNVRERWGAALAWVGGGLFLVFSVAVLVEGSIAAAALGLLAAIICLPPTRRLFAEKTKLRLGPRLTGIAIIFLLVASTNFAERDGDERAAKKKAAEQADAVARRVAERDKLVSYFEANKIAVLTEVQSLLDAGRARAALQLAGRYPVSDPDLVHLNRSANIAVMREDLKQEATLPLARRAEAYTALAELEAHNTAVVEKARVLNAELAAERQRITDEQAKTAARAQRDANLKSQFSSWDGSHRKVEAAIKERMKNPDSYQHVETRYNETDTGLV